MRAEYKFGRRKNQRDRGHQVLFNLGIVPTTDEAEESEISRQHVVPCFRGPLFEKCESINCERDVLLFLKAVEGEKRWPISENSIKHKKRI